MNTLRAGSTVRYLLRDDWGLGEVQWITPMGLLHCTFPAIPYEGEFAAGELEEAAALEATA